MKKLENKIYTQVNQLSCDYHRIVVPMIGLPDVKPKNPVFFFSRLCNEGLDFIQELKKSGVKIVCDLDDYFFLDPDHYLYDYWVENEISRNMIDTIKLADVCTTTNTWLASEILPFNKNVEIIPNALPFDYGQYTISPETIFGSKFVYVAGKSHLPDIGLLGNLPNTTICGIKVDGFQYKPHVSILEYMNLYDGHACSLAPLRDTKFNNCKSNLKMLEAGAKGIPLVASRVKPYFNDVDSEYVIYCDRDWENTLKKYSAYDLMEKGLQLASFVRSKYNLSNINILRKELFENL